MKRVSYWLSIAVFMVFMMNTMSVYSADSGSAPVEKSAKVIEETGSEAEEKSADAKKETESEPAAKSAKVSDETESETDGGIFKYIHDPRDNPHAMVDIVENSTAVYGFSPNPESARLEPFRRYDWTDREEVEKARKARRAYHESKETMVDILLKMRDEGASIEEMARAVSKERNRLRLEAYKDDPEGLATVKESNLKTYGHEDGPTPDELYEKSGSWIEVIRGAFSVNMGMDACCGLYDEFYWLYRELGYVE